MILQVAHDSELVKIIPGFKLWRGKKTPVPEVYHGEYQPINPATGKRFQSGVKITPEIKRLIIELNSPWLSERGWKSLTQTSRAFTNSNERTIDKPRLCGGALVEAEISNGLWWIRAINPMNPIPKTEVIAQNPHLFFKCLSVDRDGKLIDFPQCQGHPVYWPVMANGGFIIVNPKNYKPGKPYICLLGGQE